MRSLLKDIQPGCSTMSLFDSNRFGETNILLPTNFYMNYLRTAEYEDGSWISGPDPSAFQFLIEELMTYGIPTITIDTGRNFDKNHLVDLPPILQRRIKFVEPHQPTFSRVDKVLLPLMNEFDCEIHIGSINQYAKKELRVIDNQFFHSATNLYSSLYQLLMGIDAKFQVSFDHKSTVDSLNFLYGISKNPESRANLAMIRGILSRYKTENIGSIEYMNASQLDCMTIIEELSSSPLYNDYSTSAHELGFSDRVKTAIKQTYISSQKITESNLFAPVFRFASKAISLSYTGTDA